MGSLILPCHPRTVRRVLHADPEQELCLRDSPPLRLPASVGLLKLLKRSLQDRRPPLVLSADHHPYLGLTPVMLSLRYFHDCERVQCLNE